MQSKFGSLFTTLILVAVGASTLAQAGGTAAPPGGQLKCRVEGGVSFVVGSNRKVDCVFTPTDSPTREHYVGRIKKFGIDVSWQRGSTLVWAVLSPGLTRGPGALAGKYIGATAGAAAGVGASANALTGGNKVVLNPLSVEGEIGIGLAAGVADLDLEYAGPM